MPGAPDDAARPTVRLQPRRQPQGLAVTPAAAPAIPLAAAPVGHAIEPPVRPPAAVSGRNSSDGREAPAHSRADGGQPLALVPSSTSHLTTLLGSAQQPLRPSASGGNSSDGGLLGDAAALDEGDMPIDVHHPVVAFLTKEMLQGYAHTIIAVHRFTSVGLLVEHIQTDQDVVQLLGMRPLAHVKLLLAALARERKRLGAAPAKPLGKRLTKAQQAAAAAVPPPPAPAAAAAAPRPTVVLPGNRFLRSADFLPAGYQAPSDLPDFSPPESWRTRYAGHTPVLSPSELHAAQSTPLCSGPAVPVSQSLLPAGLLLHPAALDGDGDVSGNAGLVESLRLACAKTVTHASLATEALLSELRTAASGLMASFDARLQTIMSNRAAAMQALAAKAVETAALLPSSSVASPHQHPLSFTSEEAARIVAVAVASMPPGDALVGFSATLEVCPIIAQADVDDEQPKEGAGTATAGHAGGCQAMSAGDRPAALQPAVEAAVACSTSSGGAFGPHGRGEGAETPAAQQIHAPQPQEVRDLPVLSPIQAAPYPGGNNSPPAALSSQAQRSMGGPAAAATTTGMQQQQQTTTSQRQQLLEQPPPAVMPSPAQVFTISSQTSSALTSRSGVTSPPLPEDTHDDSRLPGNVSSPGAAAGGVGTRREAAAVDAVSSVSSSDGGGSAAASSCWGDGLQGVPGAHSDATTSSDSEEAWRQHDPDDGGFDDGPSGIELPEEHFTQNSYITVSSREVSFDGLPSSFVSSHLYGRGLHPDALRSPSVSGSAVLHAASSRPPLAQARGAGDATGASGGAPPPLLGPAAAVGTPTRPPLAAHSSRHAAARDQPGSPFPRRCPVEALAFTYDQLEFASKQELLALCQKYGLATTCRLAAGPGEAMNVEGKHAEGDGDDDEDGNVYYNVDDDADDEEWFLEMERDTSHSAGGGGLRSGPGTPAGTSRNPSEASFVSNGSSAAGAPRRRGCGGGGHQSGDETSPLLLPAASSKMVFLRNQLRTLLARTDFAARTVPALLHRVPAFSGVGYHKRLRSESRLQRDVANALTKDELDASKKRLRSEERAEHGACILAALAHDDFARDKLGTQPYAAVDAASGRVAAFCQHLHQPPSVAPTPFEAAVLREAVDAEAALGCIQQAFPHVTLTSLETLLQGAGVPVTLPKASAKAKATGSWYRNKGNPGHHHHHHRRT